MVKKAVDGLRDLLERTGGAKVRSVVLVDQPYAQDQHENLTYKHPSGQAKYLEEPMYANSGRMIQRFASRLLKAEDAAMLWHEELGVKTGDHASRAAPIMFGDLRESMDITTKVGSAVVAHRPPAADRLTPAELRFKDEMRGNHGWDLDL